MNIFVKILRGCLPNFEPKFNPSQTNIDFFNYFFVNIKKKLPEIG